ncbi:MAG: single-stranded DNA exonuclease RecJ [Gammaproteobacteria bacterium]|nr:single-stranded DNA exonuclease RecJ [Gammaproteobacteria bacterium]
MAQFAASDSDLRPTIIYRTAPEAVERAAAGLGLHPVAARVLARRAAAAGAEPDVLLGHRLADLDHPDGLPHIDRAAARIVRALRDGEVIGLATDHDVDGVTAHALLYRALVEHFGHPAARLQHYIGLRLMEGYGLSDSLCERMLAAEPRPGLIITADMGSSDGPRIARLAAAGIDVIVTDHHGLPGDGVPEAAWACVSPLDAGSVYPDACIAGVMVAWLLMCHTRNALIEAGALGADAPGLGRLLDYVALGTVADCVSLSRSVNNRRVLKAGLKLIEAGARPCWQAFLAMRRERAAPLLAADLAFGLGPRINATGRLGDAMEAVQFLLADSWQEACDRGALLTRMNEARKGVEQRMQGEAMGRARALVDAGRSGLALSFADGHPGVHGIVASRLAEAFGRPVACFSPVIHGDGMLTGSCRSVPGFDVAAALRTIDAQAPRMLHRFGGHAGAAGLTLGAADFDRFSALFDGAVKAQLSVQALGPKCFVDGELDPAQIDLDLVDGLAALEPFGREFEPPLFSAELLVTEARAMGQDGRHWRLELQPNLEAVWFNAGSDCPVDLDVTVRLLFRPEVNWWNGRRRLQLVIEGVED